MYGILAFFRRNYFTMLFAALEFFSLYFVFRDNYYHNAGFFNSSNEVAGSLYNAYSGITEYFGLRAANNELLTENARLHNELMKPGIATAASLHTNSPPQSNSYGQQYDFIPAQVIDNSTSRPDNYLTLDAGADNGVSEGMGVVCPEGIVGIVVNTSSHYSVVMSLLNKNCKVSAMIKKSGAFGTLTWSAGQNDINHALLSQIPLSEQLKIGDTIITSGYSTIFPKGIMVGTVEIFKPLSDQYFYRITLKLSTNFKALHYVYLVNNLHKKEETDLQKAAYKEVEE